MDEMTTSLQEGNYDYDFFMKLDFNKLPRLIGRSNEREILNEVYSRLAKNESIAEIIFIHGESGVGKSTLIENYLQEKIVKERNGGYFICGKYDQLQNVTKPFGAIVDAITDLSNQVKDNSRVLHTVQKDLFATLGNETSMLTKLIPALVDLLLKPIENDDDDDDNDKDAITQDQQLQELNHHLTNKAIGINSIPKIQYHDRPTRKNSISSQGSYSTNVKTKRETNNNNNNEYSFQIFVHLFRTFLRTFCKPTRPLILFLDDLQWADDASCKLIHLISADPTIQNLIIVGAYRDNDEAIFNFDYNTCKLKVTDISVGPLSQETISEIIAIVTSKSPDETIDLAQVVLNKTGGNTFFAIQYLEALYRQKLLFYNLAATKWTWNLDNIKRNTTVSDNIVDLLIGKIQSLPVEMQSILMFSSCLGFTFDIEVLQEILVSEKVVIRNATSAALRQEEEEPSKYGTIVYSEFTKLLVELTNEGLIQPFNERKYQFSHDRVQQSSNTLLPKGEEGDQLYLHIGEIILEYSKGPDSESWMLFRAVDLLLSQKEVYVTNESKKMKLVYLNLDAANEAVAQVSYLPAVRYIKQAIDLLNPTTMWDENYELCLELFGMQSKMQLACGNITECLETVDIILQNAKSLEDKLPAHYQRVLVNGVQINIDDALAECESVLKVLGIRFPSKANKFHVLAAVIKTKRVLKGRSAKDLVQLPTLTDPTKIMTIIFLAKYGNYCYQNGKTQNVFICVMKLARMSIKYGICPHSLFALPSYGIVVAKLGNVNEAQEYGKLAYEFLKRPNMEAGHAYVVLIVCSFIEHLRQTPLQDILPKLLECYRIGMEQGDIVNSINSLVFHTVASATIGMRFDNFERQVHSYCEICREFGQESRLGFFVPFYQFALNMAGKSSNPLFLEEDEIKEQKAVKSVADSEIRSRTFYFVRMMSRYMFGAYDFADCDRQIVDKTDTNDTGLINFVIPAYAGLTCLACARKYPKKKKKYQKLAQRYINIIKKYVDNGSVNGPPILNLLLAENLSLKKDKKQKQKVKEAYDAAIRFNRRSGFRLYTAISLERAGNYFYTIIIGDNENDDIAKDYLYNAYNEYQELCAFGKLKLMKEQYPFLKTNNNSSNYHSSSSVSMKMQATVLKASKDNALNHHRKLHQHSNP